MIYCIRCYTLLLPGEQVEGLCSECANQRPLSDYIKQKQASVEAEEPRMENKRPEKKIRIGAISASVWKRSHSTKDGREFETRQVSLDRTYKDGNDNWKSTNSYSVNDIPKAVLALQQAYEHIVKKPEGSESVKEEDVE